MLAAGHSAELVLDDYCAEELQVYYEAAIRTNAKQERDLARVIRVANNAKSRDFQKFVKQLEETPKRIDRIMGRRDSVRQIFNQFDNAMARVRRKRN